MVVIRRWTLVSAVVAVTCGVLTGGARADDSPYYVTFKTWALATPSLETGLKVVSFLPRRYLLYIEDRDAREEWFGVSYLRAVTQDGVNVLVDPDSVSRKTFRQWIGTHEVIFNSEFLLCKHQGCRPSDVTAWSIDRGDAFQIAATEKGVHRLEGQRDGPFHGFISVTELEDLKQRGLITRVDESHPRYSIEKRRVPALATKCGETRPAGNLYPLELSDFDATTAVLKQLKIALVDGERVKVTADYGERARMYEFFSYQIEDHEEPPGSPDRFFDVAAGIKYVCRIGDLGIVTRQYIEVVTLGSSRRAETVEIRIEDFGTPKDLLELTDSPYMISINKPSHFSRALDILSSKIKDRTLAGYAITELNRSCRSLERANPKSKCLSYEY